MNSSRFVNYCSGIDLFKSLFFSFHSISIEAFVFAIVLFLTIMNKDMQNLQPTKKFFDIIIVGGGLSGLMAAYEIQRLLPKASWTLLEARDVLGGRLTNDELGHSIDLGGAWIWPRFQPHMRNLTSSLKLQTFLQPDDPSATRIDGGAVQYIHSIVKALPSDRIIRSSPVASCTYLSAFNLKKEVLDMIPKSDSLAHEPSLIQVTTTANEQFFARRVIMAVPPKIVSRHVQFTPPLTESKQRAMDACHTWMAGVTKVSLVFPTRFWTNNCSNIGLQRGPAFHVYDVSPKDGSKFALTFFTLVPFNSPARNDDSKLAEQISSQLQEAWESIEFPHASQVKSYSQFHVKRWPAEGYIAEDPKPTQIHPHPHPIPNLSTNEWNNQLLFAGSETDTTSPGVMEGAVAAAIRCVQRLVRDLNEDYK
jgi:monoamine oxidase